MGLFRTAPDFWWRARPTVPALALWPFGAAYGLVTAHRMLKTPTGRSKRPVICVGNFVAGGAGKTPFALALADLLAERGHEPVFLLRGYGGSIEGPVLVDGLHHSAAEVGDEALLLAAHRPTVVSVDRMAGAEFASGSGDVVVMDDGFQNPSLKKDLTIALVDAANGVGNGLCLPAGPLRAPVQRQMPAVGCLCVIGTGTAADRVVRLAARRGVPILRASLEVEPDPALAGERVLAFAGIGRPEKFFASVEALGADIVDRRAFPDHHPYDKADAQTLLTAAERDDLTLVTTAKDMARLRTTEGELIHWLASRARVISVRMRICEPERLLALVEEAIERHRFGR